MDGKTRRKKGVLDRKQKEIRDKNGLRIQQAVSVIERRDPNRPFALIEEIEREVNRGAKEGAKITPRTIHTHLKRMGGTEVFRNGRGRYCTKHVLVIRDLCNRLLRERLKTKPYLESQFLDRLVSEDFSNIKELLPNPIRRWRRRKIVDGAQEYDKHLKGKYAEIIRQKTRILIYNTPLSPEIDDHEFALLERTLSQSVTEFLVRFIELERNKKIPDEDFIGIGTSLDKAMELVRKREEVDNDKTFLERCGLQIIIDFNPAAANPLFST